MSLQQVAVAVLCVFLSLHWAKAVVNNVKSPVTSETSNGSNTNKNIASSTLTDSIAASSDKDAKRREIPAGGLSDSYGVPIPSNSYGPPTDSYIPPLPSNPGLPVPVYGVPNGPTKNVIYPALPPDIPPPLLSLPLPSIPSLPSVPISGAYGPPKPIYGPPIKLHPPTHHKPHFHKPSFSTSFHSFKAPRPSYGPPPPVFVPKPQYGPPPKPVYGPPKIPKPIYGPPLKLNFAPPKPLFVSSKPAHGPIKITSSFGAPLATYGPPHSGSVFVPPKPIYGPPSLNLHGSSINIHSFPANIHGPPANIHGPPANIHGPPANIHGQPVPVYGPPEPIPHGPPHPGAPAPPTPPDIKYDGWQPIPGLVSRPPSHAYGAPLGGGLDLTPPLHNDLSLTYASSFAHGSGGSFGGFAGTPSDSYGAPLNSVTGSGGVVSSSGNDHISFGHGNLLGGSFSGDSSLSVIKSIGYEIFPTTNGLNLDGIKGGGQILDSYGAPPADSFASDGPYPAALTQKHKGSFSSAVSGHSSGIGLIPPSGIYGVPPGGHYGAPLLSPPKHVSVPSGSYGAPNYLNALDVNPPKAPVVFREPVPAGLIQSIGESVAHKDAHGIEHSQSSFHGQAYIPPPVPDITKQKDIGGGLSVANSPSNLYSLPNVGNPVSFQSVVHGSTNVGKDFGSSFNIGGDHNFGGPLTSYTAPLGAIDSTYGVPPLQPQALTASAGFDQSQSLDLSSSHFGSAVASTYTIPQFSFQSTLPLPHDCSQYKSQPLPQTGYGLPSASASSYSTSISSLNTNIGGQENYQLPITGIASSDLQPIQLIPNAIQFQNDVSTNSLDVQGKSLGQEYFGKDSEFQKSQEVQIPNGLQNIPIQGNLGSYTLQIQSADGLGGHGPSDNVPHEQVLSEGLLQSILAAIEQPQQQQLQKQHLQQPPNQIYGDLQHASSGAVVTYQQNPPVEDGEAQHSVTRKVVVSAPDADQQATTPKSTEVSTETPVSEAEQSLHLIDNNEIALYFTNNNEPQNVPHQEVSVTKSESVKENGKDEVRNGQQYGSFVSFKNPHSSYVYGELKSPNSTQLSS